MACVRGYEYILAHFGQNVNGFLDVLWAGVVAEGEADEGGEVHFVIEVVVGTEVAGAGHDVLVGEGGTY